MRSPSGAAAWLLCCALAGCSSQIGSTVPDGGVTPVNGGLQFSSLYSFRGEPDGEQPEAGLTVAGGAMYGTAYFGGERNAGAVYRIETGGQERVVYSFQRGFNATDGSHPRSDLVAVHNTLLFGTTVFGGGSRNLFCAGAGCGTVFQVGLDGNSYRKVYSFENAMVAARPSTGLIQVGTNLYGTTVHGGGMCGAAGCGTIFEVNPTTSAFDNLHDFLGSNHAHKDGAGPLGVMIDAGGSLYGTTDRGGTNDAGTIFKIKPSGATEYETLRSFAASSLGVDPKAGLLEYGGELYGTTYYGGANDNGTVFKMRTDGTGYEVLHSFARASGANPEASLIAVNGTLYGTTYWGGANNLGTVFGLSPSGKDFQLIHSFNRTDGAHPLARLLAYRGMLYGTTQKGGSSDRGTVFQVGPVAEPTPTPSPTMTPTPAPTPTPTPTPKPGKFFTYAMSLRPLAYYRLDASSGTAVADSSGNAYTGTLVGSATPGVAGLLAGDANKAVDLTGGYVALPSMTGHRQFTLLTLVRANTYGASRALVGYYGNYLSISGGKLRWCTAFTASCSDARSPALTGGKAYLLAMTVSISSGVAKVGCSTNGAPPVDCNLARYGSNALFSKGNFLGHGPRFANARGTLDESIVFPAILSQTQLATLANYAGY